MNLDLSTARLSPADLAVVTSRGHWQRARHLDLLNEYLLKCSRREITRLMVFEPPRHGKSQMISRYLPAWWLGTFPDQRVVDISYGEARARVWGRLAKHLFEAYAPSIWGLNVSTDSKASDSWDISGHEGGMITAGIGGALTGGGADLMVIDDPVKNAQEAWSATTQEAHWDWWTSTAYTRMEPGGVIIIVMTRWHENDLAGRILKNADEPWTVLNLPAIAEEDEHWPGWERRQGEALWPERYAVEALRRIEKAVHPYYWQAMYQQNPQIPAHLRFFDLQAIEAGERSASMHQPFEIRETRPFPGADPDGYIHVWERPLSGGRYIIGADTAQGRGESVDDNTSSDGMAREEIGGPDFNAAAIYKWPEMVQVAAIHGRQEEHQFARLLNDLGRAYNNALLAVERNRRSVLVALRQLDYPNLFATDRASDMHVMAPLNIPRQLEYGWSTDTKTRPILLADMREAVSAGAIHAMDKALWAECRTFILGDPPAAMPGRHDDRVMAHAIAWQMRAHVGRQGRSSLRPSGIGMTI